jgi:hypothetical protein
MHADGVDEKTKTEITNKIVEKISGDAGAVSKLIDKIILQSSCPSDLRSYALQIFYRAGAKESGQLIEKMRKKLQLGSLAQRALFIRILAELPVETMPDVAAELARIYSLVISKIRTGEAKYEDYYELRASCEDLPGEKIHGRLYAIGLTYEEADDVRFFVFDNMNDYSVSNIALTLRKELGRKDLRAIRYSGGLIASSEADEEGRPAFHKPDDLKLNLPGEIGKLAGVFIKFKYHYKFGNEERKSRQNASLRLTFGNISKMIPLKGEGEGSLFIPGNADSIRMEVWQGNEYAEAETEDIYLVYSNIQ